MKTKEKILHTSIQLFNRYGFAPVTLRKISAALNISLGNLTYHYKNKQAILEEIYSRMENEMDSAVFPGYENADLIHLDKLFHRISDFHHKYRFFYLDVLDIQRTNPQVIQRYQQTLLLRKEQTSDLYKALQSKELLHKEPYPGYYSSISHSIWIMSTFWIQHKKILGNKSQFNLKSEVELSWDLLFKDLTESGLKQFKSIQKANHHEKINHP